MRGRSAKRRPSSRPAFSADGPRGFVYPCAVTVLGERPAQHDVRGHLFLWAYLVAEAQKQALEREVLHQRELRKQADVEERYWPHEPSKALAQLRAWRHVTGATTVPGGPGDKAIVLTLAVRRGEWPDESSVAIHFSLCARGIVRVKSEGFPDGHRPFPEFVRDPSSVEEAKRMAVQAVASAIRTLEAIEAGRR